MAAERVVALGLALLGAAQDRVELIHGIAGHEGAQQRNGRTDYRQVDVKIGAREAEQRADVAARKQHRVDLQPVSGVAKHDDERRDAAVADHAADDGGRIAAIERCVDDFHQLRSGALPPAVEMRSQFAADLSREITRRRRIRLAKGRSCQQLAYRALQVNRRPGGREWARCPRRGPRAVAVNSICSSTPIVANTSRVIEFRNVR